GYYSVSGSSISWWYTTNNGNFPESSISWASGEPNHLWNEVGIVGYWNGSADDQAGTITHGVMVQDDAHYTSYPLSEKENDYYAYWTGNAKPINDSRQIFTFHATSNTVPVMGTVPVYSTVTIQVPVQQTSTINQYQTVWDTTQETIYTTSRVNPSSTGTGEG